MVDDRTAACLQSKIWQGSIPLQIRLAADECRTYDESHAYLVGMGNSIDMYVTLL